MALVPSYFVKYDTGGFRQWVHRLTQRAPRNNFVVAIAASPGPCCPAAKTTGISQCNRRSLMAVKKTLRLASTERFPLSHRHDEA